MTGKEQAEVIGVLLVAVGIGFIIGMIRPRAQDPVPENAMAAAA